jgi:hypothetical protein
MGDATVLALLSSTEPPCMCSRNLQHPSRCACSSGCNGQREQAKIVREKVDILLTKQKWQHEEGWFKAIRYFNNSKDNKLTWAGLLFKDGKVDLYVENADDGMEYVIMKKNSYVSCEM